MALGVGVTKRLGGPSTNPANFMMQASRGQRGRVYDKERFYESSAANLNTLGPGPSCYSRINPLPRDKAGTGRDGPSIPRVSKQLYNNKVTQKIDERYPMRQEDTNFICIGRITQQADLKVQRGCLSVHSLEQVEIQRYPDESYIIKAMEERCHILLNNDTDE